MSGSELFLAIELGLLVPGSAIAAIVALVRISRLRENHRRVREDVTALAHEMSQVEHRVGLEREYQDARRRGQL